MSCLFRQDGPNKGKMDDPVCLRGDGLGAKVASLVAKKTHASNMGFLRVVPAPLNSEWVLVVKGEKWVPLLNSFLSPIHFLRR